MSGGRRHAFLADMFQIGVAEQREQRRDHQAEQGVDPDQRDIEANESDTYPDDAQGAVCFHRIPRRVCVHRGIYGGCAVRASVVRLRDGRFAGEARLEALQARRVVLAVSGGRDSMSLMHAAAASASESVACVASFDHATGVHSARAAGARGAVGRRLGFEVVRARATSAGRSEAEWRAQRWSFLRRVARERGAQVATAHTRDDQIETVLMRVMRGSGARGLAALAAEASVILRPLLACSRAQVAAYAARARLEWVEDPSNARAEHLRNRVRSDLLPALTRARPSLPGELLAIGKRAAELRAEVERFVDRELSLEARDGAILVAREILLSYDAEELALLWPAIAARVGVTLDRRGTERLIAFTTGERHGARMQLSGGYEAVSHRGRVDRAKGRRGGAKRRTGAFGRSASGQFSFRCAG